MVCRMCQAVGTQLEVAYKRQMIGVGISYRERQRVRVQCLECGEDMALRLLSVHIQMQHGKAAGGRRHWGTMDPGRDPRTYKMAFPTLGVPRNCPIKWCRGRTVTRMATRVHFIHRNFRDNVIILY